MLRDGGNSYRVSSGRSNGRSAYLCKEPDLLSRYNQMEIACLKSTLGHPATALLLSYKGEQQAFNIESVVIFVKDLYGRTIGR